MAAGWIAAQRDFLESVDAYARAELALAPDYQVDSHEAGGHYRLLFPHVRVRGGRSILSGMSAVFAARRAWAQRTLHHGYVDCDEVHHHPETFLFFQMPLMFLAETPEVVEAVVDFAHHVGNWVPGVPAWYDWERHGFRSTWLGTREVRAFPPYDYQEANHFRFVAVALAAFVATGDGRYRDLATDYASRWCDHIEGLAAAGEPIACSILPAGVRRREMGSRVPDARGRSASEYPVFYQTVATNTACEIAVCLIDIHRLTGDGRMLRAARALLAQFWDRADPAGRPPSQFSEGAWRNPQPRPPAGPLEAALAEQNFFLVRVTEKYRAVSGDAGFDAAVLRWAEGIDEERRPQDRLHVALMAAAHRISGNPSFLERSCRMSLWGMAATEENRIWHQCDGRTRYGFRSVVDAPYDALLAGADYAARGGLPLIGLEHGSPGPSARTGLPPTVALRCWEPTPTSISIEAVNTGGTAASWRLSSEGSGGSLQDLVLSVARADRTAGTLTRAGDGWLVSLAAGGHLSLDGTWAGRGLLQRRDVWQGA
jgi:hypothetical protein